MSKAWRTPVPPHSLNGRVGGETETKLDMNVVQEKRRVCQREAGLTSTARRLLDEGLGKSLCVEFSAPAKLSGIGQTGTGRQVATRRLQRPMDHAVALKHGGLLSTAVRYSWTGADDPSFGCNKVLGATSSNSSAPAKLPAEGRGASRTGSAGKNGGLLLRVVGNSSTSGIYPSFGRNKVLLFD